VCVCVCVYIYTYARTHSVCACVRAPIANYPANDRNIWPIKPTTLQTHRPVLCKPATKTALSHRFILLAN